MRALIPVILLCGGCPVSFLAAAAEPPKIAIVIEAHEGTPYRELLPVIERSKEVTSALKFSARDAIGIAVTIEIRSDIELVSDATTAGRTVQHHEPGSPNVIYMRRDDIERYRKDLRRLGVKETAIESIPILRTNRFSVRSLNANLKDGKTVLLICEAKWSIESAIVAKHILNDPDVIDAATRSGMIIMRVDMTEEVHGEAGEFLRRHSIIPMSFSVFEPDQEKPRVYPHLITKEKVIELIGAPADEP